MRDRFIQAADPILQRLETAGFEAYLVGGCVREALRAEMAGDSSAKKRSSDVPCGHNKEDMTAEAVRISDCALPTDIDITTNALPEQVCRVFSDMRTVETGIRHGTVTVLFSEEPANGLSGSSESRSGAGEQAGLPGDRTSAALPIEITTYRVDGTYSDGRHPDQVSFVTSLTEDLRRRDFTINAMAMDRRGEIADPFGGRADLEKEIIRAVGNPETRFREDGLRILRALRFAAVLDFRIEKDTEAALFSCRDLLAGISAERIFAELKKLVAGKAAGRIVREYTEILGVFLPELLAMKGFAQNNPYHKYDVLEHCIRAMEAVQLRPYAKAGQPSAATADPGSTNPATADSASLHIDPGYIPAGQWRMKLTALLHDVGKPEVYSEDENGIGHFYGHPQAGAKIVIGILKRLNADRFTTERIETLVHYHDLVFQEDERLLKRWLNKHGPEVLLEILAIKRADNIATGNVSRELLEKFDRIDGKIRRIIREAEKGEACFCLKDLAIGGKDLIEAGIPEGPEIGRILNRLLEKVIEGELPNERAALIRDAGTLVLQD